MFSFRYLRILNELGKILCSLMQKIFGLTFYDKFCFAIYKRLTNCWLRAFSLCVRMCVCLSYFDWPIIFTLDWGGLIAWLDWLDDLTIFSRFSSVHIYIQIVHDFTTHIYMCACMFVYMLVWRHWGNERMNDFSLYFYCPLYYCWFLN